MTRSESIAQSATTFPETADIESSSDAYAARFSGAAGQWLLDVQEKLFFELLAPWGTHWGTHLSVLDVGGGHGQLAIPLTQRGYRVTVLGSHPACEHRIKSITETGQAHFITGNVIDLPFPDQSFDVVISFRLVTHCGQWEQLIAELCRVARQAVIVDYPTSQSLNAIAPSLFAAKQKVETNTRPWTLFKHDQIKNAFQAQQFAPAGWRKQFFLPMVVHRMLKSRPLSASLESICRGVGLTALAGSPVIAAFRR
jgi:2-polyprenyl-3-methyl-5-hydroxy-6-metoxy-1,4-benzoquinol methylase